MLAAVPPHFGVVRGAWRNFVPRPDGDPFFAERMTVRYCDALVPSASAEHALEVRPPRPRATCASAGATTRRSAQGLVPLRGWYPFEILHFPVRSLEHCRRKYVTQFVALERNAEKGIPGHMAEAYRAYLGGDLDGFYAPLVVDDDDARARARRPAATRWTSGSETGCARSGSASERAASRQARSGDGTSPSRRRFAGEYSALQEADVGLALGVACRRARDGGSRRSSGGRSARVRAALSGRIS